MPGHDPIMGKVETSTVEIGSASLTTATWGHDRPSIVFLHDGLGSITQWRSIPASLAQRTGRTVLAYDRSGHGRSTPAPTGPWPARWLHREADVLRSLCEALDVERPVLVGHSDGGSIALIHAAGGGDVAAVLLLAAHSWVESKTVEEIAGMAEAPGPMISALGRHHYDPAALFRAWSGVWLSKEFSSWDIRPSLGAIEVPVMVAQGGADEYATAEHARATAEAIGPNAELRMLAGLGHLVHLEDPDLVVNLASETVGAQRPG